MRTDAALAAGFVVMWSSGFVGAVLGTASASSLTLLMWRFLVAAVLIGAWWSLTRRRRITARQITLHGGVGLLSQGVYLYGVVTSAELGVPAGVAALVAALQPIVAATLGGPLLGERTLPAQWIGLLLGLVGVAFVVSGDLATTSGPPLAYTLPFAAMLALVAATFVERRAGTRTDAAELPLTDSLLVQCVVSAVVFSALALLTGQAAPPSDGGFWLAVMWVVVLSTFGGYGFYWLNVRRGSVTRVSSLLYLTPPVTMLLAYLMFDERIAAVGWLGLAICLGAVLLVLRPRKDNHKHNKDAPRMSVRREMMPSCSSTTSSPHRPGSPPPARAKPRSASSPNC
jgi:drug/metabolite transporter (DMT)-like permease